MHLWLQETTNLSNAVTGAEIHIKAQNAYIFFSHLRNSLGKRQQCFFHRYSNWNKMQGHLKIHSLNGIFKNSNVWTTYYNNLALCSVGEPIIWPKVITMGTFSRGFSWAHGKFQKKIVIERVGREYDQRRGGFEQDLKGIRPPGIVPEGWTWRESPGETLKLTYYVIISECRLDTKHIWEAGM